MTVTVGVDSYVDETQLIAYAALRGYALIADPSVLLIKAMDNNEPLSYKGSKTDVAQPLEWPRINVYVDGILIDSSVVPVGIENGQMAQAITIDKGFNSSDTVGRSTKKEKLAALEVEYMDNARDTSYSPWVNRLLQPYLKNSNNGININVGHA